MERPLFSVDKRPTRRPSPGARAISSDLRRRRPLLVASIASALGVGVAAIAAPPAAGLAAPAPIARPHREAGVSCASCHGDPRGARGACVGCHGEHPSTRAAHRALACVDCHAAHGDSQGVTFTGDGGYVRWGGSGEVASRISPGATPSHTSVPLVALTVCARCHRLEAPRDPITSCVTTGVDVSLCFDEHQRVDAWIDSKTSTNPVACASQHGPDRFVAWSLARRAAVEVPWVASRDERARPFGWIGFGLLAGAVGFVVSARRRRAPEASRAAKPPPTSLPVIRLLPRIDPQTCLGCYACVEACPFDVLTIERYVAVVARPSDCCSATTCADVCPNASLALAEAGAIESRPNVDAHLESLDAPGVFLAGDLTGLPLIKNAIRQGRMVVDRIAQTLGKAGSARSSQKMPAVVASIDEVDVIIVGAGPAGISAALRARELGLSCVVLEQATVAASIQSFPRDKLVFDQPLDLPVEGELWLRESTKEELLAQWTRIVRTRRLPIREGHRVVDIERVDGAFVVTAEGGNGRVRVRGARLILAIGRRGSPRRLGAVIDADAEAKVSYAIADARAFAGLGVLVVGLGDAAMEAAVAIGRQPGASVTVVHRGETFARGKARNVAELQSMVAQGRVRLLLQTTVERVARACVDLQTKDGPLELENDRVVVLIGGVPSTALLEKAGIRWTASETADRSRAPCVGTSP